MTNFLKKYWFVSLVVLFLCSIIVFFIYDTNKGKLPGKTVDGNSVVYSINKIDKTADEFYNDLYDKSGVATIYAKIEKAVANQGIETTEEMKTTAKTNAANIIANFQQQYGQNYETQLLAAIKQVGYSQVSDLETYLIQIQKINKIFEQYVEANPDTTIKPYMEEAKPMLVSHILVKMADPANPSEEEAKKVKEVEDELAKGTAFSEVATKYSDDTGSAAKGGSLGVVTKDAQFVPEFLEAMLQLNEGEVSSWVTTEFGKHLIKIDASTLETLKTDETFYCGLYSFDPTIQGTAIWKKAEELGIDFKGNDELKAKIIEYLNITGKVN